MLENEEWPPWLKAVGITSKEETDDDPTAKNSRVKKITCQTKTSDGMPKELCGLANSQPPDALPMEFIRPPSTARIALVI